MDGELERIIVNYYPRRTLESPLGDRAIRWEYDPDNRILKAILRDLERAGLRQKPGTQSDYRISEEIVLDDRVRLHLSYLGPYAAIDRGAEPTRDDPTHDLVGTIEDVLAEHGVRVLRAPELEEAAAWIRHDPAASVWRCLFGA